MPSGLTIRIATMPQLCAESPVWALAITSSRRNRTIDLSVAQRKFLQHFPINKAIGNDLLRGEVLHKVLPVGYHAYSQSKEFPKAQINSKALMGTWQPCAHRLRIGWRRHVRVRYPVGEVKGLCVVLPAKFDYEDPGCTGPVGFIPREVTLRMKESLTSKPYSKGSSPYPFKHSLPTVKRSNEDSSVGLQFITNIGPRYNRHIK